MLQSRTRSTRAMETRVQLADSTMEDRPARVVFPTPEIAAEIALDDVRSIQPIDNDYSLMGLRSGRSYENHWQQRQRYREETRMDPTVIVVTSADSTSWIHPIIPDMDSEFGGACDSSSDNWHVLWRHLSINTLDERAKYKNVFFTDFMEYRELHERFNAIAMTFVRLDEQLGECELGSREYFELRRSSNQAYLEDIKTARFAKDKRRLVYLQKKLAYIKELVERFDKDARTSK